MRAQGVHRLKRNGSLQHQRDTERGQHDVTTAATPKEIQQDSHIWVLKTK